MYTANNARDTLLGYLQLNSQDIEYIANTSNRGFIYKTNGGNEVVIFVCPIGHKSDGSKNYIDLRDSGGKQQIVAWKYAIENGLKYFCLCVHDEVYKDYILSLESNEEQVAKISGTLNGIRNGTGTQIVFPIDYVPEKSFDRIKTDIGVYFACIHKGCIEEYLNIFDNRPYMYGFEEFVSSNPYSHEWFREKAADYPDLDVEAVNLLNDFKYKFSPEKLSSLFGKELLHMVFLNNENTENLCRVLEYDAKISELFGSIKGGTAYKYGLFFSTDGKWMSGTNRNPKELTENEAIKLGTEIRDCLVNGAKVIEDFSDLSSIDDYKKLYKELNDVTKGYVNRSWFMKYYFMLFPELFASDYSDVAQRNVLSAIDIPQEKYPLVRMGQIKLYTDDCGISNVMFNRIFWDNYTGEAIVAKNSEDLIALMYKTNIKAKCCKYNRIIFGAPGTGKSHTLEGDRKELLYENRDADEKELDLSQYGSYERVTFHPDYSYANFVGTYKPVPKGDEIAYEYVPGPFMRILVKALESAMTDTPKPYVLLIEEINRANTAAVFGDVFQLLDRKDGISEYPIQTSQDMRKYLAKELMVSEDECKEIRIPDNMFIWATMNSADQGVYPMDTAFKRRWDFTYIGIDDGEENIPDRVFIYDNKAVKWNDIRKAVNNVLEKEYGLNEDKLLGPFFISRNVLENADDELFWRTFDNKVLMYLCDDALRHRNGEHLFEDMKTEKLSYAKVHRMFQEKGLGIFNKKILEESNVQTVTDSFAENTNEA